MVLNALVSSFLVLNESALTFSLVKTVVESIAKYWFALALHALESTSSWSRTFASPSEKVFVVTVFDAAHRSVSPLVLQPVSGVSELSSSANCYFALSY